MNGRFRWAEEALGKKLTKDVFSKNGVLLVSTETTLTQEHVRILQKHGIALESDDLRVVGPYADAAASSLQPVIDESVMRVETYFQEVRANRKIPLGELRKHVIPVIEEVTEKPDLFELLASLQAKDDYTYRHNIGVSVIATLMGKWMSLGHTELLQLTTAALLYDVGKMLIPQEILNKPDALTPEEFEIIKTHTTLGYEMIKQTVGANHRQALVALQHHERMDGSGYPNGVKKWRIDPFSRIVSVADVFHAMTSQRMYRGPSSFYEVLSQMKTDAFKALDPALCRLFLVRIMQSLIGKEVLLTDGAKGKIIMINPHDPIHPLIQVDERFIDLGKHISIQIDRVL